MDGTLPPATHPHHPPRQPRLPGHDPRRVDYCRLVAGMAVHHLRAAHQHLVRRTRPPDHPRPQSHRPTLRDRTVTRMYDGTMLELAQSVKVTIMGRFESSKRVKSGETTLQYVEDHDATAGRKGQLAIPDSFSLAIPVFEGRDPYRVTCRFRYRIQDGALLLGYVIDRPEDVLRIAVAEVVDEIRDGWDGPLFVGRPQ